MSHAAALRPESLWWRRNDRPATLIGAARPALGANHFVSRSPISLPKRGHERVEVTDVVAIDPSSGRARRLLSRGPCWSCAWPASGSDMSRSVCAPSDDDAGPAAAAASWARAASDESATAPPMPIAAMVLSTGFFLPSKFCVPNCKWACAKCAARPSCRESASAAGTCGEHNCDSGDVVLGARPTGESACSGAWGLRGLQALRRRFARQRRPRRRTGR